MKQVIDDFLEAMSYMNLTVDLNANIREILHNKRLLPPTAAAGNNQNAYHNLFAYRNTLLGNRVKKRQFDSSLAIVYIYSNFEIFVDELIDEYIKIMNNLIPKFGDMPKAIKDNHIALSINLLEKIKRFNHLSLRPSQIIENMYKTDQSVRGWQLNFKAFSLHSANLRLDTLKGLFENIGIHQIDVRIRSTDVYKEFLSQNGLQDLESNLNFLDILVESRNSVSHGWRLSEYQQDPLIIKLINDMRMLALAIYEVIKKDLYTNMIKQKYLRRDSAKVKETFLNGQVIIAKTYKNVTKSTGDKLFYIHFDGVNVLKIKEFEILSIQVNGVTVQSVSTTAMEEIGFRVNGKASKNGYIYSSTGKPYSPAL